MFFSRLLENGKVNRGIFSTNQQPSIICCTHIQIRSFCTKPIQFYENLLAIIKSSSYLSVEIITKYCETENEKQIKEFIKTNNRVKAIIFHSASVNKIYNDSALLSMANIAYTKQIIQLSTDCHNNNEDYFNVVNL